MLDNVATLVSEFGYPIVMSLGMGYFIYYVWQYLTQRLKPQLSDSQVTLIKLLDQIRQLDNDLIRLQQKVNTVITYRENQKLRGEAYDKEITQNNEERKNTKRLAKHSSKGEK